MSVRRCLCAALLALASLGACAAQASAQDRIYWTSFDSGKVEWANLDGSGGTHELNAAGVTIVEQSGYGYGYGGSIDPVQGRYYWANEVGNKIAWANLDGSGGGELATGAATISGPISVAVDPVGRRAYWTNSNNTIGFANLDGSGGGDLNLTGALVSTPISITAYPAAGRVYWTNFGFLSDSVAFARTDGSGGETVKIGAPATLDTPYGVAIDAAAKKLYWANDNPGIISVANLDGSNSADIDNRGLQMKGPYAIALDPEAGRAYTANFAGNDLTYIGIDGSGGATVPVKLAVNSGPNTPVLYKEPKPTSASTLTARPPPTPKPKVRNRRGRPPAPLPKLVGGSMTCSGGGFAPDLVEARLYRAPVTVSHVLTRDGVEVGRYGDTLGTPSPPFLPLFKTDQPGNYRCQLVGTNVAGTTTRTSPSVAIFKTGPVKRNLKKGTVKLTVELPAEAGALGLAAKGFKSVAKQAAGTAVVLVKPTGAKKAKLAAEGKLNAIVKLSYTPPDGPAATLRTRLTLKQR